MSAWQKIKCFLDRHEYEVVQEFSPYSRRIGCPACRKTWGMNDDARAILPWDMEMRGLYLTLGHKIERPRWEASNRAMDRGTQ